jgi:hypothetical protein
MFKRSPIHLLIRYSDRLHNVVDAIGKHQDVLRAYSTVWFGDIGRDLSERNIDRINRQCKAGIPSYLYFVQRAGGSYRLHQATLLRMTKTVPEDSAFVVPDYYRSSGILGVTSVWAHVLEIVNIESEELGKLRALSSIMPMTETLPRSKAAHFFVREYEPSRWRLASWASKLIRGLPLP